MPVVHEDFGHVLATSGEYRGQFRDAKCPYMGGKLCDGGSNRDMMRWPAGNQPRAPFFDLSVGAQGKGFIPCGVCSIRTNKMSWMVCPRRLLTFDAMSPSRAQRLLIQRIFRLGGFMAGDKIRVWSEITLRDKSGFNYRIDYVLRADDRPPVIVEILTASTSGGNRAERTDMQSAFCDAVLFAQGILETHGQSPGVNIRQVWARMASQLVAKSEVANQWGGRAIWVVQDALMAYISSQTGLRVKELHSPNWKLGEINVISCSISDPDDVKLYSGSIHSKRGEACWAELSNAPSIPRVESLNDKLVENKMVAVLKVA